MVMLPVVIVCLDFQKCILLSHLKEKKKNAATFPFPGMWFNLIAKLIITSCLFGANKESTVSASGHNGSECEMDLSIWLWATITLCNKRSCMNTYYITPYCLGTLIKVGGLSHHMKKLSWVTSITCKVKKLKLYWAREIVYTAVVSKVNHERGE